MIILFVFDTKEDTDKFLYIYNHYLKYIYYTVRRYTNDSFTVEDLSQDVLIKIAENLSHFDMNDPQKMRNYVITIAQNHCKNYIRSQSKFKEESYEEWKKSIDDHNSQSEDILNLIIKKETRKHLIEEIGKLNDIYQTVLELKYFLNFSNDEIARFLNVEKKTVEMRLYRANKLLSARLKDTKDEK